jgi:rhodanese-related sulfurtransferase
MSDLARVAAGFLGLILAAQAVLAAMTPAQLADPAFPYRKQYLPVDVISTEELARRLHEVVVVDVRSQYEFETLSIKGAVNIPLGSKDFVERLRPLRAQSGKPLVFYCNGVTCLKSYDAAVIALDARIDGCYAYDAGVFAWAKAHPESTVALGKTPIEPKDLISEDDFKARLLAPKDFESRIGKDSIVLDVRDPRQRDNPLFPFKEWRVPLDDRAGIERVVELARRENKTLLIYDAAGHQVRWLQYRLERQRFKNYYFMKGGAQGYWEAKFGKIGLGGGEGGKASGGSK